MFNTNNLFILLADKDPAIAFGNVHWYGITMTSGIIVAIIFICLKLWKWYKLPIDPFYWYAVMAIPTSILGARMGSCIIGQTPWDEFFENFGAGLSIEYGVLLTVLLGVIYFPIVLKKPQYQIRDTLNEKVVIRQVSLWCYADVVLPCVLIGQVIGRWGNYRNQELYGPVVTDENTINFLKNFLPLMFINGEWHQPIFFYESCANFVGFVLLYFVLDFFVTSKKIKRAGDLAILYFIWYGIVRLCCEPFRFGDSAGSDFDPSWAAHRVNYLTTIIWIICGNILLVLNTFLFPRIRKYRTIYMGYSYCLFFFERVGKCITGFFGGGIKEAKAEWKNQLMLNRFNNTRLSFIRSEHEMLYYRGF